MTTSSTAKVLVVASLALGLSALMAGNAWAADAKSVKLTTTADHSQFKELQQVFTSGPQVTQACLRCHTEAARQVHRTKHWTWETLVPSTGQKLGKKNVLNNFCISIPANTPFCTSCHVGYGWKDASFDFTAEDKVDCLVCHDSTGIYRKLPGLAGHPPAQDMEVPPGSGKIVKGIDLAKVAQKVGKSSRDTCGACHFFGGGGDGVKHGDMDSSLAAPDKAVDVHMDATGLDFSCATCHKTTGHDVPGSRYTPTAVDRAGAHLRGLAADGKRNPATCTACHGNAPHKTEARLNHHADKLACQTCHIPTYARGGVATKLVWDWSTSGQRDAQGQPLIKKDAKGHVIYDGRKGDFTLGENVVPEYVWFNGDVRYTLLGDKIAADGVTPINQLGGSPTDGRSQIWPVKVMRGTQPYDPVNQTLVTPHTAGPDEAAYWKSFGWEAAIASGMKTAGAPFSGQVGFVKTEMAWPLTHMVAPKNQALGCADCHARAGRLAGVPGVYLPGRDQHRALDMAGFGLAVVTLIGVLGHGALRLTGGRRKG